MKKMMSWCLMAVMVTGLLAGCGGSKDTNPPAAQLGNMNDILEQQKSGDIQLTIISSIALAGISPYCFDSWPFMFESQEEFRARICQ